MPGDIKAKYGTSDVVLTLGSVAASQTFESGFGSNAILNGSTIKALDYLLSGSFATSFSNRQAGEIRVYLYTALSLDIWPDIFTGTEATEGSATVIDIEQRDSSMALVRTIYADIGSSEIYTFAGIGVLSSAELESVPEQIALWVTHNISTTTTNGISGGQVYIQPVYAQYT